MSILRRVSTVCLVMTGMVASIMVVATGANAASSKLGFSAQFGADVNAGTHADLCSAGETCQDGTQSETSGGFSFPYAVAEGPLVSKEGDVYVSDTDNARVQIFNRGGVFVGMFGWDVNKTKVDLGAGATQEEKNVCTASSGNVCQKGEPGVLPGQLTRPESIVVDQSTGDVYVLDGSDQRVEEYSAAGGFIQTIGSGLKTGSPSGDLMAIGGPEDRLYVSVEGHVLEFDKTTGTQVGEISSSPLSANSEIRALAVDPTGDVYLVFGEVGGEHNELERTFVHEFPAVGTPSEFKAGISVISALAVDPFGRLAITEFGSERGFLYSATGVRLGEFGPSGGFENIYGISFNSEGELYVTDSYRQDVEIYVLITVAVLVTGGCKVMGATGITLTGEVNPEGLSGEPTRAWFEYGTGEPLEFATPSQDVGEGSAFVPIEALLEGLRPNQKYFYRVVARDQNDRPPEPPLAAETTRSCETSPLPPSVEGSPEAFDSTFTSVVLGASINPENAKTTYRFQYAPACGTAKTLDECPGLLSTPALESSAYGQLGVRQTVGALKPGTPYLFRLVATNEHNEETVGNEGSFTTEPEPAPIAVTAPASNVTATTAILNGAVNPDGANATFSFQAAIANGAGTALGTVMSGSTGPQRAAIPESYAITGLQPGTIYLYTITVASSYGSSTGIPVEFSTTGIPTAIAPPLPVELLPTPNIKFPKVSNSKKTKKTKKAKKKTKKKTHKTAGKKGHKTNKRTETQRNR